MPRIPRVVVALDLLDMLFYEFDIWTKIQDGRLTGEELRLVAATAWPDATSFIVKHSFPNGKHIATTHCVRHNRTAEVLHWDAKDLRLHDVRLRR